MRPYILAALAAATCAFALPAVAGQADICYSADEPLGGSSAPTSATLFDCPLAGANKTLNDLAQAGWEVVQLVPVTTSGSTQANQLVVQKP